MKYIIYIHVHVLHILNQQSSVKKSLAIQKRKLLIKWWALTWHLRNMALIVIYLKKKNFIMTLFLSRSGKARL